MTSSIRWEPIEDLKAVQSLCRRVLGDKRRSARMEEGHYLLVDIYETNDAFVAEVDAPGIKDDDLDVSVLGSELMLKIERKAAKDRDYVCAERPIGSFSRALTLPAEVDEEEIQAVLKEGTLILTMPKKAEAKGVVIEVMSKD